MCVYLITDTLRVSVIYECVRWKYNTTLHALYIIMCLHISLHFSCSLSLSLSLPLKGFLVLSPICVACPSQPSLLSSASLFPLSFLCLPWGRSGEEGGLGALCTLEPCGSMWGSVFLLPSPFDLCPVHPSQPDR